AQAGEVRKVKKYESGMVVNPVTITPEKKLADARKLMAEHKISGIPVVEKGGKLAGILTNRDVRFATDPKQPIAELMTKENLVTVREGVDRNEAKRLLHKHRIEKLLVVDKDYHGVGDDGVKRAEALFDAGVDIIVVDTAHGHSEGVLKAVDRIRRLSNYTQIIAGN